MLVGALLGLAVALFALGRARGIFGSVPERLIAQNLYQPSSRLYHLADLQRRPAIAEALGRLRAAGLCEVIFKMRVSKMRSDQTYAKPCDRSAEGKHEWWRDHELSFEGTRFFPLTQVVSPFAVLADDHQVPYLIGFGKDGTLTAEEMERQVVTVLDTMIAGAPGVRRQREDARVDEAAARHEHEAAAKRVADSFE